MSNALAYIFFMCSLISLLAVVASLITPRVAFFLRKKTRLRAMMSWFGICCLCLICMAAVAPRNTTTTTVVEQKDKLTSMDNPAVTPPASNAGGRAAQPTQAVKPQKSEDEDPRIFEYQVSRSTPRKTRHGRVDGGLIYIYPSEPDAHLTSQKIGATCLAAAKFFINNYSREYEEIDNMLVVITDAPYDTHKYNQEIFYGKIGKLATCHYLHSNYKGWEVITLEASARNTTHAEKQIEDLWLKLHGKYKRGNRIDDAALKKEIGLKLNINPEDINFTPVTPEKLDPKQFKNIAPHGPVKTQD